MPVPSICTGSESSLPSLLGFVPAFYSQSVSKQCKGNRSLPRQSPVKHECTFTILPHRRVTIFLWHDPEACWKSISFDTCIFYTCLLFGLEAATTLVQRPRMRIAWACWRTQSYETHLRLSTASGKSVGLWQVLKQEQRETLIQRPGRSLMACSLEFILKGASVNHLMYCTYRIPICILAYCCHDCHASIFV